MTEGMTCYERDETLCEDQMCLRTGCRLRNERLSPSQPSSELLPPDPHIISGAELMRLRDRIAELEAALRQSTDKLGKVAAWLDRLATAAGKSAANCSYESLREAYITDANNYRKTVADIKPTVEAGRAALPQSSTPARATTEPSS